MLRLFSTSIVRQIVAITLCLLAVSTAAIVGVTYYNLSRYVMISKALSGPPKPASASATIGANQVSTESPWPSEVSI